MLVARLPVAGPALAALPPPIHWVAIPVGLSMVMLHWRPDGLKPHAALWWLEAALTAQDLSCWQPAERGADQLELGEIACAPDGREWRYRPGRVSDPAEVLLRYPARGWQRGRRLHVEQTSDQQHADHPARRRAARLRGARAMSPLAARVPPSRSHSCTGTLSGVRSATRCGPSTNSRCTRTRAGRDAARLMGDLADAADGLQADFQLLRISRQWSLEDYADAPTRRSTRATATSPSGAPSSALSARLEGRAIAPPELRAPMLGFWRARVGRAEGRPRLATMVRVRQLRLQDRLRGGWPSEPSCGPDDCG